MLRVADIVEESLLDGEGINLVIFLQGCSQHCVGCHNPSTWDYNNGYKISIYDILHIIKKNPLITGVTFSGGEPIDQYSNVLQLAKLIKQLDLNVILYTGYELHYNLRNKSKHFSCFVNATNKYGNRVIQKSGLDYFDTIIDGRFIQGLKRLDLPFRGSSNQRILRKGVDY